MKEHWPEPVNFSPDRARLEAAYKEILESLLPGMWDTDVNTKDTPARAAKAMCELTAGYGKNPEEIITVFEEKKYDQIVLVRGIGYYSLCAHHLLPFFGEVKIAYIPHGKVLGLSKFARMANLYARRLQIQERMTQQIALAIETQLKPKGVMVQVTGTHLCMSMRGVECPGAETLTQSISGCFENEPEARAEAIALFQQ